MTPRDPYQVLGVPGDASGAAIRRAYKKLARRYHPDVNPGDAGAEERFKEISEAYALLSDPQKKKAFDRFGGGLPGRKRFRLEPARRGRLRAGWCERTR